jgi:energy-coupling factor transport system permease protein
MDRQIKSAGRFSPAFLFKCHGLHPAVKIFALIIMAILIPQFTPNMLIVCSAISLFVLVYFRVKHFFGMMKRMRWLFLSVFFIYAFTMPGEYLRGWPIDLSPTYEGLREGFIQLLRISLMLAGVSMLMATTTREKLMVGIYVLTLPFKVLNLSPERFTARLYLTLQYMEQTKDQKHIQYSGLGWQQRLSMLLNDAEFTSSSEVIRLENTGFSLLDYIGFASLLILAAYFL